MRTAETYEELRPLLFSIAYRMLGSVAEAEDIVQEAFLRYHALGDTRRMVQTIRSVINPEKLRHLGPLSDVPALFRERAKRRGIT